MCLCACVHVCLCACLLLCLCACACVLEICLFIFKFPLFKISFFCREMNDIMKESSILLTIPSHKHIVKMFGVCIDFRHFGIVLEYIDGGDLSTLLSSHTFVLYMDEWKNKLDMTCQIADGMKYLHGLDPPVIHRDLKPNNILVKKSSTKYTCKAINIYHRQY